MSIKASLSTSANIVSVSGLFQWDYGRVLEIESAELGSEIVEVHFAYTNMSEAIVCSCAFSNGIGTVTIPDQCLEQSSPITAWVYRISGTTGYTYGSIRLNVTARQRPSIKREIPQEIDDRYTQLITEINEAVDALEKGKVTAMNAVNAQNANNALTAGNAQNANHAVQADIASESGKASGVTPVVVYDYTNNSNKLVGSVAITDTGLYIVEANDSSGTRKSVVISILSLTTNVCGAYLDAYGVSSPRFVYYHNGSTRFIGVGSSVNTTAGPVIYRVLRIPLTA